MAKKVEPAETVTIDVEEAEKLHAADDLMGRIEQAEEACASAASAYESAKADAKLKKEVYESCVMELRKLARARKEELPLFDGQPGQWKSMSLVDAGLTAELAHPIVLAGIETFGDLVAYMRSQGSQWFQAVRGIGEEKAGMVADIVAAFWAEHPEAAKEFEAGNDSP